MRSAYMNSYIRLLAEDSSLVGILNEAVESIPPKTDIYVVGGAARNAVYYSLFKKTLPQRDYDLLFTGDLDKYIGNLRNNRFTYGKIRRKNEVVLKKRKFPSAKLISDYVVLDIHVTPETNILKNLSVYSNFTINGFAIPLQHYLSNDFKKYMIALPNAEKDLRNLQIHVNKSGYKSIPSGLFACLRFMSIGFMPPGDDEIKLLLDNLPTLEKWRFERNVKKVFDYVGGEEKARKMVKDLGIDIDIFDFAKLKDFSAKPQAH